MEVLQAYRDVGRGVSKSEGQAIGHVTCTEMVADWAFSWIKIDWVAETQSSTYSAKLNIRRKYNNEHLLISFNQSPHKISTSKKVVELI